MNKFVPAGKVYNMEIDDPSELGKIDGAVMIFDGRSFLAVRSPNGEVRLPELKALNWSKLINQRIFRVGELSGRRCYLIDGARQQNFREEIVDGCQADWLEMRSFMARLSLDEMAALIRGHELQHWWRRRQYCGVCGGKNQLSENEIAMICPNCGEVFYPEISIAVITAIVRGDEILLAHNNNFVADMYGLISGFVEIGENMEQAVSREIKEEIGVSVKNIRYFSSQCWPYPSVLMAGFWADYDDGVVAPDKVEISDAKFYRYDNLPLIPKVGSIARRIIDEFVRERTQINTK